MPDADDLTTMMKDPDWAGLSPDAKKIVIDKHLPLMEGYGSMSPKAQGIVKQRLYESNKIPESSKGLGGADAALSKGSGDTVTKLTHGVEDWAIAPAMMAGGAALGAAGGSALAPGVGTVAGGIAGAAAGSAGADVVNAEINHMFLGEPAPKFSAEGDHIGFEHPGGALEESAVFGGAFEGVGRLIPKSFGMTDIPRDASAMADEEKHGIGGIGETMDKSAKAVSEKGAAASKDAAKEVSKAGAEAMEKAGAEATKKAAASARQEFITKTPAQTEGEQTGPPQQYASRLAETKRGFSDAYEKIHEEAQAPYEEQYGPIRDEPVSDEHKASLEDKAAELGAKYSLDPKEVMKGAKPTEARAGAPVSGGVRGQGERVTREEYEKALAEAEGKGTEEPMTYGKLQRMKNLARIAANRPGDAAKAGAAGGLADHMESLLNEKVHVPQDAVDQYAAHKSLFDRPLHGAIQGADSTTDIGEKLFAKSHPQVALQLWDHADKAGQDRMRESLMDYANDKKLSLAQIGKQTNPEVLKKMFGGTAYEKAEPWLRTDALVAEKSSVLKNSPAERADFEAALEPRMKAIYEKQSDKLRTQLNKSALKMGGPTGKGFARQLRDTHDPDAIVKIGKDMMSAGPGAWAQGSMGKLEGRVRNTRALRTTIYGTMLLGGMATGHVGSIVIGGTMAMGAASVPLGMRTLVRKALESPATADLAWRMLNSDDAKWYGRLTADLIAGVTASRAKKAIGVPQDIQPEESDAPEAP